MVVRRTPLVYIYIYNIKGQKYKRGAQKGHNTKPKELSKAITLRETKIR